MYKEIKEIPEKARMCYKKNKGLILPENLPYLGMGSSHIATKVFRYLGIDLYPEMASDYYNYLTKYKKAKNGVLISQSGHSSETMWCAEYFDSFIAIVNNEKSPLGQHENCSNIISLYADEEKSIPGKTYINTLITMYLGFGFDPWSAIEAITEHLSFFQRRGVELGEIIYKRIRWRRRKGIYIIGSGPNIATAAHAALILGKVTKLPVASMAVAQYDHGAIESAQNTLVIGVNHEGPDFERTKNILNTVQSAGGKTFELISPKVDSIFSPITFSMPFFFAVEYLASKLNVSDPFSVGKKITKV